MAYYLGFAIANVALEGIVLLPLFIFTLLSCCLVRKRNDPARVAFWWLKATLPIFFLSMLTLIVSNILYLVDNFVMDYSSLSSSVTELGQHLSSVSLFFDNIASILVMIAMAELGIGFLYALARAQGQNPSAGHQFIRYFALAVGLLFFALSAVLLGMQSKAYHDYYQYANSRSSYYYTSRNRNYAAYDSYVRNINIARKLASAIHILMFVVSLPLLVFASMVMHKYRKSTISQTVSIYLVATVLWFIRRLWLLVYTGRWLLSTNTGRSYEALSIVNPILNTWLFFISLVLLFVVGARKTEGLWSTEQPWSRPLRPVSGFAPNGYAGGYTVPAPAPVYAPVPAQYGLAAEPKS